MATVLPLVSAATAALIVLLQTVLMLAVVRLRRQNRVSLGDGSNPALQTAIRRHANLAENGGLFIAAISLLEMLGAERYQVGILCGVFLIGRVLHAGAIGKPSLMKLRIAGIALTAFSGFGLSIRLILKLASLA